MPAPKPKSSPAKASKKQHENSSKVEGKQKPLGYRFGLLFCCTSSLVQQILRIMTCRPRARALEAVKRFAPEHLVIIQLCCCGSHIVVSPGQSVIQETTNAVLQHCRIL